MRDFGKRVKVKMGSRVLTGMNVEMRQRATEQTEREIERERQRNRVRDLGAEREVAERVRVIEQRDREEGDRNS